MISPPLRLWCEVFFTMSLTALTDQRPKAFLSIFAFSYFCCLLSRCFISERVSEGECCYPSKRGPSR